MQLRALGSLEVKAEVAQTVDHYPDKPPPLKVNDRLAKNESLYNLIFFLVNRDNSIVVTQIHFNS